MSMLARSTRSVTHSLSGPQSFEKGTWRRERGGGSEEGKEKGMQGGAGGGSGSHLLPPLSLEFTEK